MLDVRPRKRMKRIWKVSVGLIGIFVAATTVSNHQVDKQREQLYEELLKTNIREFVLNGVPLSQAVTRLHTALGEENPFFKNCSVRIHGVDPTAPIYAKYYHVVGIDCVDFLCKDNLEGASFFLRPHEIIIAPGGSDFRTWPERFYDSTLESITNLRHRNELPTPLDPFHRGSNKCMQPTPHLRIDCESGK